MMTDLEIAGAVLVRFLTEQDEFGDRPFFYIHEDDVCLDGSVNITFDEACALLRITDGRIDGPGLRQADPEVFRR